MKITLLLLLSALSVFAGPKLGWNTNSEPTVTGYVLYIGTNSGNYSLMFTNSARTNTTIVLTNLPPSVTLYAAVSARDSSGVDSDLSNELSFLVPKTPTLRLIIDYSPNVEGPFLAYADIDGGPILNEGYYRVRPIVKR